MRRVDIIVVVAQNSALSEIKESMRVASSRWY